MTRMFAWTRRITARVVELNVTLCVLSEYKLGIKSRHNQLNVEKCMTCLRKMKKKGPLRLKDMDPFLFAFCISFF